MRACPLSGRSRRSVGFHNGLLRLAETLVAVCLSLPVCFAQHQHAQPRGAGNSAAGLPPGTIDGSVTPQLITDAVAYRLFLNAACQQPQSTLDEKARQRAILSRAQLSETELAAVVGILAGYQQQMGVIEGSWNAAVAAGETPNAATQNFPAQRDAIVTAARAALAASLSAQGMARLDQLIQSEKGHMKVVPYPNMP